MRLKQREVFLKQKQDDSLKLIPFIVLIVMIIFSFSNLFGWNIAGLSVIAGVAAFFLNQALEKQSLKDSRLNLRALSTNLRDHKIWFWILLPLFMDIICLGLARAFLPQYIAYETHRAGSFVPIEISIVSTMQFLFFALGEEIAWRAFFQNELTKVLPITHVLLISSVLFTLGHFKAGDALIVVYGLFFTFINSILYGIVFHKTKNAWASTFSHFVANMFSVIAMVLLS